MDASTARPSSSRRSSEIRANVGELATTTSADAGYFSAHNVEHPALANTNLLIPPERQKHRATPTLEPLADNATPAQRMRHKLSQFEGRAAYKRRKAIVEPVFGQIKEARGIRRLLLRGVEAARGEFNLIALTHNLLKLFRYGARPALLPVG